MKVFWHTQSEGISDFALFFNADIKNDIFSPSLFLFEYPCNDYKIYTFFHAIGVLSLDSWRCLLKHKMTLKILLY